jgi:hypothetical protein
VVAFAVDRYVQDAPVDPYVVLRPRRDNEPVQPALWRELLGSTLDLGMLPLSLANARYLPCQAAAVCEELLVLTALDPIEEPTGSIVLNLAGSRVELTLAIKPGQRRYVIPLARLWPGVAARAAGISIEVVGSHGFLVDRTNVARPPGRLY